MRSLAIIPARGNSKGLPGKNIREIAGKPLIAWSIEQALESSFVTDTLVSTDSPEIADVARASGALVPFLRPSHLASDTAATEPVMLHALAEMERNRGAYDLILLLQPTSPYRTSGTIDRAFEKFVETGADSLLSVVESHAFLWQRDPVRASYDYCNRPRRQDIKPEDRRYRETGSLYLTKRQVLVEQENRLGGEIMLFEMNEKEGLEIDSLTDFVVLESIMKEALNQ
ncbi:acylneuraminate cytidylyltransferase family protein [Qipengyuania sp. DY56-A-20]|uniref:Acylneuraminate cytidylyltransferase family protein n=1 Tax=Qipengyuania benthica TaxID=3067651 RepID=A0ABT9HB92_9SPHN|nr:acylneuraminate cytidylyltransferase family protein [Qipengyuania sp. DY56-A-20]MDP4540583.1 acylneuraminate cytidylyltransferase family protein [Qipengyuania sp. DY56-A-20]